VVVVVVVVEGLGVGDWSYPRYAKMRLKSQAADCEVIVRWTLRALTVELQHQPTTNNQQPTRGRKGNGLKEPRPSCSLTPTQPQPQPQPQPQDEARIFGYHCWDTLVSGVDPPKQFDLLG
jgi:hypothetical protein